MRSELLSFIKFSELKTGDGHSVFSKTNITQQLVRKIHAN